MTPPGSPSRGSGSFPRRVGDYEIVGELARGGQGVVYQGRTEGGRSLAVKVLLDTDARSQARFEQEAKVLAGLRHPHLPRMHDFGRSQGRLFMSMEFVEGQDLRERVKSTGSLPVARATEVLAVIAGALHYCHTQGVVHRDLKPANIMIERDTDRPVLVDFGLLKRDASQHGQLTIEGLSRLSLSGEIKGTPGFMAPEQADASGSTTVATDVYALGATLYYLLTAETPFRGSSAINTINKLLHEPAPDPRLVNGQVSAALAELCQAAMAKDPADRPQSAADFARLLLEANEDPPRTDSPGRGTKGLVGAGLVVLVGLLAAIGIVVTRPVVTAASPTPSVSVESESPPVSPPVATPRLWALEPGDSFTLVHELTEINSFRELRFVFDFSATVTAGESEDAVEIGCELLAVQGGIGPRVNDELIGPSFDSRSPSSTGLAALGGAVGKVLTFQLDQVHGRVSSVEGMEEMREAVLQGQFVPSPFEALKPERIKGYMRAAFSAQHVQHAFDALLHLGDDATRRVPWLRTAGGDRFLSAEQYEAYALVPLNPGYTPGEGHRFDLSGEARFSDGRLASVHLEQIMGLAGDGGLAPLPGDMRMEIKLAMEWKDFRSAAGE